MPKLPLGLKKTYKNITKLDLTFLSDVESTFTLVIDEICETAEQFDIQTDVLDKLSSKHHISRKLILKEKHLVDNSMFPQLYGIITKTRRQVSFEQPMQLKAGLTALRRFFKAVTPRFIRF